MLESDQLSIHNEMALYTSVKIWGEAHVDTDKPDSASDGGDSGSSAGSSSGGGLRQLVTEPLKRVRYSLIPVRPSLPPTPLSSPTPSSLALPPAPCPHPMLSLLLPLPPSQDASSTFFRLSLLEPLELGPPRACAPFSSDRYPASAVWTFPPQAAGLKAIRADKLADPEMLMEAALFREDPRAVTISPESPRPHVVAFAPVLSLSASGK